MVIETSNDATPIMEAVKAQHGLLSKAASTAAGARYVGSIDPITAANWAKEWNVKLHSKEFNVLATNRIKNDSDWRNFKMDWT